MDVFLQAIETFKGLEEKTEEETNSNNNKGDPQVIFGYRPPQWCIVDKWFTMAVLCYDENIKELEAFVYNSEGSIIPDALIPEYTNDKDGRKIIVSKDNGNRATFRLKFANGSKGNWLYIGVHCAGKEKCLLKSPPIKVQTNRSKRPRDNRKKPTPIVTSLSPASVPAQGNFPGRKDRMLLIFGSNFYLWGSTPVVRLKFLDDEHEIIEIRPPGLIWWSENLLECQLPECSQDLEVQVANYDMVFGEGKVLKVTRSSESDSTPKVKFGFSTAVPSRAPITSKNLILEYLPSEGVEEINTKIKVLLHNPTSNGKILAETGDKCDELNPEDIVVVVRVYNKASEQILQEVAQKEDPSSKRTDYMMFTFHLSFVEKIKNSTEPIFIAAYLRHTKTGKFIMDPLTKQNIKAEKPVFGATSDDDDDTNDSQSLLDMSTTMPVGKTGSKGDNHKSPIEDLNKLRILLSERIVKLESAVDLVQMESILTDSLNELKARRRDLKSEEVDSANKQPLTGSSPLKNLQQVSLEIKAPKQEIISTIAVQEIPPKLQPPLNMVASSQSQDMEDDIDMQDSQQESPAGSMDVDDDDEPQAKRGKLLPSEHKQEISLAIADPKQKNGVVYWKFFNPGNRTFLDLVEGKLQIIGSRRIQMLIESIPSGSKFINAHLYVNKNDNFEAIDNCARCKENGIPNVFCILPRRGREHDYPWITFRITCTSTAKHWKGSLFWIGAEYLTDPVSGTTMKVFSPPIYVQSKVKAKELAMSGERPPSANSTTVTQTKAASPLSCAEDVSSLPKSTPELRKTTSGTFPSPALPIKAPSPVLETKSTTPSNSTAQKPLLIPLHALQPQISQPIPVQVQSTSNVVQKVQMPGHSPQQQQQQQQQQLAAAVITKSSSNGGSNSTTAPTSPSLQTPQDTAIISNGSTLDDAQSTSLRSTEQLSLSEIK